MDLYQFLNFFHKIDEQTFQLLSESFKIRRFFKNEIIISEGETQRELFFIREGVHHTYLYNNGKKNIIGFSYPPQISAIPDSFHHQTPSKYCLEALTNGEMYTIHFDKLQELFDRSQQLERLFRKITEVVLTGVIQRHLELHTSTIEQRYKAFTARSPQLLHMVPHKYIASYLNIDPTNFSKLFNSVVI